MREKFQLTLSLVKEKQGVRGEVVSLGKLMVVDIS